MNKTSCKKFAVGLLSGAIILAGSSMLMDTVQAAESVEQPAQVQDSGKQLAPKAFKLEEGVQRLAQACGVDASQVLGYCQQGGDFRDACMIATLSKLSGKSFQEVVSVKGEERDWHKVAAGLGVTDEMLQEERYAFEAKRIAEYGNLEEAVALQLLKDGYRGRDIEMAGRLAKASGKDVQAVLAMKKINNRWYDVADALGVAWDDIRAQGGPQDLCGRGRAFHGHGGPRHGWQNDGPGMQGAGGYRGYHYDGQRPCEPQRN